MIPPIPGMFALGTAMLSACGSKAYVHPDSGTTTGTSTGLTWTTSSIGSSVVAASWTDDGGSPGSGFCGDTVHVTIADPLGITDWDFGMVEAGVGGWAGEDCLNGFGGYALCHAIGVDHTLTEVADCTPASVVAGSTTLMDASKEPYLTYYLADTATCFVWGADVAYYAALSCDELM